MLTVSWALVAWGILPERSQKSAGPNFFYLAIILNLLIIMVFVRSALGAVCWWGHGRGGRRSPTGRGCVVEGDGECERVADRGPIAAGGGGHKISQQKVNVLSRTRVRLPLS
jgi:hypothetical protein